MKENQKIFNKFLVEIKSYLWTLIVSVVTIITTSVLHFLFSNIFTTCWVIVICWAIILSFAIFNVTKNKMKKAYYTREQKKNVIIKMWFNILTVLYVDILFICMFMNWIFVLFILVGLYLIRNFYIIASMIVNRRKATSLSNFSIVLDTTSCFLLMILLIYEIPDERLQTIVTALTSALIGGVLTLVVVVMTIKKSDMDREKEEINKARPIFSYNMLREEPKLDFIMQKICISDSLEELEVGYDVYVELENSNLSFFEIKRIYHDDKWVKMEGNTIVLPGSNVY